MQPFPTDTICAIATASGGAIGVVRVSGPDALTMADSITARHTATDGTAGSLTASRSHTLHYRTVVDADGKAIDEALVSVFRAPHSYTGEDSVEISCHGSQYILAAVVRQLTAHGCRMAGPGEFTKRAFMNGRMDLSQAEAVADMVSCRSEAAHRAAIRQLTGDVSSCLAALREKLLHLTVLLELELDFSDHEDLEFASRDELQSTANEIQSRINRLISSYTAGRAIKHGVPVAIVGPTNAGKSTLLNALLGDERAIVSPIAGTTRDTIEERLTVRGTDFRLIDTAGLRATADQIEAIGIGKALDQISRAAIALCVIDATAPAAGRDELLARVVPQAAGKPLLIAVNKTDKAATASALTAQLAAMAETPAEGSRKPSRVVAVNISAKTRLGLDNLLDTLYSLSPLAEFTADDIIITSERHHTALTEAHRAITRVTEGICGSVPADLLATDLRQAVDALGQITGTFTHEDVLSSIFQSFCVGK